MAFPALLDTCVLYPAYLCDTLLRLAEAQACRTSPPRCAATCPDVGRPTGAATGHPASGAGASVDHAEAAQVGGDGGDLGQ
jgi:hypothetical protein